jgi:hypothetical protein
MVSLGKNVTYFTVGVQRTWHITVITGTHQLSHGRLQQNPSSATTNIIQKEVSSPILVLFEFS